MRAKLVLEFSLEIPADYVNTAQNREILFNEIRDDLPEETELVKLLLFCEYKPQDELQPI